MADTNKRPVLFENLVYYNTKDKAWTKEQIEKTVTGGTLSNLSNDVASLKETSEATISEAEIDEMFAEAENDG